MKIQDYSEIYGSAKKAGYQYVAIVFKGEGRNCRANCLGCFDMSNKKSDIIKKAKLYSIGNMNNEGRHIEVFDTTNGSVRYSSFSF